MNAYFNSPAFRSTLPAGLVPATKIYNDQDDTVFTQMSNAFMTDGTEQVQFLINAGKSVNVFSGQLDLIVDTLCTCSWINKLTWSPSFSSPTPPTTSRTVSSSNTRTSASGRCRTRVIWPRWTLRKLSITSSATFFPTVRIPISASRLTTLLVLSSNAQLRKRRIIAAVAESKREISKKKNR